MTTDEMFYSCTLPLRLAYSIRKGNRVQASGTTLNLLTHNDGLGISVRASWILTSQQRLFLCPGGRWLIGTALSPADSGSDPSMGVLVWDLAYPTITKSLLPIAAARCSGIPKPGPNEVTLDCLSMPKGSPGVVIVLSHLTSVGRLVKHPNHVQVNIPKLTICLIVILGLITY